MSPLVRFLYVITFSVVTSWSRNFMDFPEFYLAKIDKNCFSLNIAHKEKKSDKYFLQCGHVKIQHTIHQYIRNICLDFKINVIMLAFANQYYPDLTIVFLTFFLGTKDFSVLVTAIS